MVVWIKGESTTEQLDRWIAGQGDDIRSALNLALGRLEAAEADVASLVKELRDMREASTCPDCGRALHQCSYCQECTWW
jgi:recombinational DNA repair protein RecR